VAHQGVAWSRHSTDGAGGSVARWLPWVLIAVGAVGLLLPWLLSPVASDERYHYVAAPERMDDNVLNVLPWTRDDMVWRLRGGRIAPIGVFMQQAVYLLGMQLAHATGVPLYVVHGLVKSLLLAAVVVAFWLLLRQLRRSDGGRLDRGTIRTAVLLLGTATVIGVTAASPSRNGWTTFVVLCIGGVVLMFLTGALSLWVLNGWARWGWLGRALGLLGLSVTGAALVLSYELHWAAVVFAGCLLVLSGRGSFRPVRRQPGDAARWAAVSSLLTGFVVATLWTRAVISANVRDRYTGVELDLDALPVLRTTTLQLVNALPGTGIPRTLYDLTTAQPTPRPFGGFGWFWGLALALGLLVLLLRRDGLPEPAATTADRATLRALGGALAVSALSAAVVLSVSAQSHQIVTHPGDTYRGTPWIWVCLAGIIVVVLLGLGRDGRARGRALVIVPVAGALVAGAIVWPYTVAAIETQRGSVDYVIWESAQAQLISGSSTPDAVAHRCLLSRQARAWAGDSSYRKAYLPLYESAFAHRWERPWCPTDT